MPLLLLLAAGIGLVVLGVSRSNGPVAPPVPRVAEPLPVTGRRPVDRSAAPPRWIKIAAIGVSASVVPLGLNPDRSLEVPERWEQAGWYVGGPEPGERGPAVIAGHVDSTSGPAVFYRLGRLEPGAAVLVGRADRSVVRFRVERVERWPKDRFPTHRVYGRTRDAALRLITCGGAFDRGSGHYLDNTIVYASRVSRGRS